MTERDCDQFRDASVELALGILDGRERAEALVHLEHCPACHRELLLMGDLADRLIELTPGAEPPAGFETRVLASLASQSRSPESRSPESRPPHGRPPRGRLLSGRSPQGRSPWRSVKVALVAAALAVAVGVGGWALGRQGTGGGPSIGGDRVATAAFVTGSRHVGQVIAAPGAHPWIYMAVDTGLGDQTVVCQIRERNGATVTLGSFPLSNGYGYWGAPIPASSTITGAQLIDARGRTVATASFSAASFSAASFSAASSSTRPGVRS